MAAPMNHAARNSLSYCRVRYFKQIFSKLRISVADSTNSSATKSLKNSPFIQPFNEKSNRLLLSISNVNKSKVEEGCCQVVRHYSTHKNNYVLGIETSCDDTGAAIVDPSGNVIGEALNSQTSLHVEMGGIIPVIAADLHRANIHQVVDDAMKNAKLSYEDIDAIAVTTEPGLALCLDVGVNYAKQLAKKYCKPVIPIHHMQAHALTVRMIENLEFPFMVLLASGGHCLLTIARDVNDFLLLGKHLDDAPGDAFDKTARRMKIKNLKQCHGLSGGASIELLAKEGNPQAFQNPAYLSRERDCNFSFSGMKEFFRQIIVKEEEKQGIQGGGVVNNIADICASFQEGIYSHLSHRIRRGLLYAELKGLLPEKNRTLVLSGGVASNMYIRQKLQSALEIYDCQLICPPPKLCTDNGVMIAWNGMEKFKRGIDFVYGEDIDEIYYNPKSPIGQDMIEDVTKAYIKVPRTAKKTRTNTH